MKKTFQVISFLTTTLALSGCAQTKLLIPHVKKDVKPTSTLTLAINGGTFTQQKVQQNFQPLQLTLNNNECKKTHLIANDNKIKAPLQTCYINNTLYLDPISYTFSRTRGAIRFNQIPLWNQGFSYQNIHTFGSARLTNTTVTIKVN